MKRARTLTFYLNDAMRGRAEAGKTNIINKISAAFESRGFQCLFCGDSDAEILSSAGNPGYSLFHMEDPFHPYVLTLRRAYYYPFWRIEASAKRWESTVALTTYCTDEIDPKEARRFTSYWWRQWFGEDRNYNRLGGYIFARYRQVDGLSSRS